MKANKLLIIILAIIIFSFNVVLWYLPLRYKGYVPLPANENLVLARNLHFADKYSLESDKGVFLNSERVASDGIAIESSGNKLTPYFYKYFFDIFGFKKDWPIYSSIVIFALANLFLFLFLSFQIDLKFGLVFSWLGIFTPIFWQAALMPVFYELAILFFVLGFIFYFLKDSSKLYFLFLSGLFFSLAILARNAYAISVMAIGFFELLNKKSIKRIIVLGLPIFILFALPYLADNFYGQEKYVDLNSYNSYGYCFPDPYTFLYEKESFMASNAPAAEGDVLQCFGLYGYTISETNRLELYLGSIKFYVREFFNLITFGGPLILSLALFGLIKVKQAKKEWFYLFSLWLVILFLALVYIGTSNWDHLLEIGLAIIILVVFGLRNLSDIILENLKINAGSKKVAAISIILLLVLAHQLIADKWMFHEEYSTSQTNQAISLAKSIKEANLSSDDVVALDYPNLMTINYYSDASIVKFSSQTIESLLTQNKLDEAFKDFKVTAVAGYDEVLNQKIKNQTSAKIIPANDGF